MGPVLLSGPSAAVGLDVGGEEEGGGGGRGPVPLGDSSSPGVVVSGPDLRSLSTSFKVSCLSRLPRFLLAHFVAIWSGPTRSEKTYRDRSVISLQMA